MQDDDPTPPALSRKEQLEATLKRAVELAAEDPDAFVAECKAIGQRFGMSLEQVYQRIQSDPDVARLIGKEALRKGIQTVGRTLKEKFRL